MKAFLLCLLLAFPMLSVRATYAQNDFQTEGLWEGYDGEWAHVSQQLIALASQVSGGGSSDSFRSCVTSRAHADWVASINRVAEANHVNQTPSMFLNSRPVDLATLTPETLQSMIDKAATP